MRKIYVEGKISIDVSVMDFFVAVNHFMMTIVEFL